MSTKKRIAIVMVAFCTAFGAVPAYAQLFGPSDEEKAAQKAHEDSQDSSITQLQGRVSELEDKVRGLIENLAQATNSNEELSHQIQLENDKIDRMQKDFAYRLCTLSAQQLGAGDAINCANPGSAAATANPAPALPPQQAQSPQPGAQLAPLGGASGQEGAANGVAALPPASSTNSDQVVLGRPSGVLGTLPAGNATAAPTPLAPPSETQALAQPTQSAQTAPRYETGMKLLADAQYGEAAAAFRAYADAHPEDTNLSSQAIYWIGNISFMRQDYATAARNFAEVIKKYPKSPRASDAMLKLAQSFMALGQNSEGCTTLALIRSKYPQASPQTLADAANLRKTACTR